MGGGGLPTRENSGCSCCQWLKTNLKNKHLLELIKKTTLMFLIDLPPLKYSSVALISYAQLSCECTGQILCSREETEMILSVVHSLNLHDVTLELF